VTGRPSISPLLSVGLDMSAPMSVVKQQRRREKSWRHVWQDWCYQLRDAGIHATSTDAGPMHDTNSHGT